MDYTGYIVLSDSSRHAIRTAEAGFALSLAAPDSDAIESIAYTTLTLSGDQTFLQEQILGQGDLTLILRDWTYFGGIPLDATTYVDGTWMYRWFDPSYITYSIWYKDYDTSDYSLVGYKYRDPISNNVGDYYAPMEVPRPPGHYQIRWLYTKSSTSYGKEIIQAFTAVSRGIDAMRDYPYPAGSSYYPYDSSSNLGALVMTIPVYVYKNLGENALFTLQFNGPVPGPLSYQWRKNNDTLLDSARISGTSTNTLTIYGVMASDSAIYNCVVSDQVVSTAAYLVIDPP